ncbi:MAG: hypothetical protein K6E21_00390 [Bacilli bacterium]|nr:hypothetical protein [Bacilli bacterium]
MKKKNFLVRIFIAIAAFFLLLTPIIQLEEAHHSHTHSCAHEDCAICEVIRAAKENIKQTNVEKPTSSVIFLIPLAFALVLSICFLSRDKEHTNLVSLKIKMSN